MIARYGKASMGSEGDMRKGMRTDTRIRKGSCTPVLLSLLVCLLFLTIPVPSALAGIPVNREVVIYNVDVRQFSVAWEVSISSTCAIKVFRDIEGDHEAEGYTCTSRTNDSILAQERGLMQVDIKDLPSDGGMYYIQTVSTEKTSGIAHRWPEHGSLLPVKTEPFTFTLPPRNGVLEIMSYSPDGINPYNPHENLITDGVVVLVDGGGNYPVSSDDSGWPREQFNTYHSVVIDFSRLRLGSDYLDWTGDPEDHAVTVICLGGRVSGKGLGKRIVRTIYPEELVSFGIGEGWYPCVSEFGSHDFDGCAFLTGNRIIMEAAPELLDADGDGYDGIGNGGDDCDDEDPTVYPGAVGNRTGKDNNCNGTIDADERRPSSPSRASFSYVSLLMPLFTQNTNTYGSESLRYTMPWTPSVSLSYPSLKWDTGRRPFVYPFVYPSFLSFAGRLWPPVTSIPAIPSYLWNSNGMAYQSQVPLNWY